MTDPQDSQRRLVGPGRICYTPQAVTQLSWLGEEKKQVVRSRLKRLPKTAGNVARPVPGRPDYLAVELPDPPPPLLFIVYRYTAKLKLFYRGWEIAGLEFPNAANLSSDQPRNMAGILK
jgi:hypothetical protein